MTDFIAGLLCAVLAAMGVGGGGLLVIYLTLVKELPQLYAQGINLLFFLPSAIVSLLLKIKLLKSQKELILLLCPAAVISSLVFCLIGAHIGEGILRRIFGVFLIFAAVLQIFQGKHKSAKSSKNGRRKIQKTK